jgi:hypothetical protein
MDPPPVNYGILDFPKAPFLSTASIDTQDSCQLYNYHPVDMYPCYVEEPIIALSDSHHPTPKVLIPGRFADEKPMWVNSKQARRILILR